MNLYETNLYDTDDALMHVSAEFVFFIASHVFFLLINLFPRARDLHQYRRLRCHQIHCRGSITNRVNTPAI